MVGAYNGSGDCGFRTFSFWGRVLVLKRAFETRRVLEVGVGVFEGLEGLREAPGGVLEGFKAGGGLEEMGGDWSSGLRRIVRCSMV